MNSRLRSLYKAKLEDQNKKKAQQKLSDTGGMATEIQQGHERPIYHWADNCIMHPAATNNNYDCMDKNQSLKNLK